MLVEGLYEASGGEKFLTIGNFFDNENCSFIEVDGSKEWYVAKYFVDDVSVIPCNPINVDKQVTAQLDNIYPNPFEVDFKVELFYDSDIIIKDNYGREVLKDFYLKGNHIINLSAYSNGVFFIFMRNKNKTSIYKMVKG